MLTGLINKDYLKGKLGEVFVSVYYFFFYFARTVCFRYKTKNGEIDIILRRGNLIIFCEVKTRIGIKNEMDSIENLVSERQMLRIRNCASEFIKTDKRYRKMDKRFDIAVVSSFLRPPIIFENYEPKRSKFDIL